MLRYASRDIVDHGFYSCGKYKPIDPALWETDPSYRFARKYVENYDKTFQGRKIDGQPVKFISVPVEEKGFVQPPIHDIGYSLACIREDFRAPGMQMMPYERQSRVMAHFLHCPAKPVLLPRQHLLSDHRYSTADANPGSKLGAGLNAMYPKDLKVLKDQVERAKFLGKDIEIVTYQIVGPSYYWVAPKRVFNFLLENETFWKVHGGVARILKEGGIMKLTSGEFRFFTPEQKLGFEQTVWELQMHHANETLWKDRVKEHPSLAHIELSEEFKMNGIIQWTEKDVKDLYVTVRPVPGDKISTEISSYMKVNDDEGSAEVGVAEALVGDAAGSGRKKRKAQQSEGVVASSASKKTKHKK